VSESPQPRGAPGALPPAGAVWTPALRRTTAALAAVAFFLKLSYSLARPATESLFLETQGSDALPWVWLLEVGAVVAVVAAYNRLLPRTGLAGLFGGVALGAGATLPVLLLLRAAGWAGADWALYLWKDLYMILLVELFYSFANSVYPIRAARWAYGIFGVVGSVGGVVGNLGVGWLAGQQGTVGALWLSVPVFAVLGLLPLLLRRAAAAALGPAPAASERPGVVDGAKVVGRSTYLAWVVGIVVLSQLVITLVDFSYNQVLSQSFPSTDLRTAASGQVYAALNVATLVLHASTGPLLRLLGVPAVLLGVPALLGLGLASFALWPLFAVAAVCKVASKCMDYTIFKTGKEILYIPLTFAERTAGKAVVDILGYRVAKGGASLLLLGLLALGLGRGAMPLALGLGAVWIAATVVVVRRFRAEVSRDEEMRLR